MGWRTGHRGGGHNLNSFHFVVVLHYVDQLITKLNVYMEKHYNNIYTIYVVLIAGLRRHNWPVIEYACPVWQSSLTVDELRRLEAIQK